MVVGLFRVVGNNRGSKEHERVKAKAGSSQHPRPRLNVLSWPRALRRGWGLFLAAGSGRDLVAAVWVAR